MNQTYKKQLRCKLCGIVSVYNELLGIRTNKLTFKAHLLCTYQEKHIVIAEISQKSWWMAENRNIHIHSRVNASLNIY